MTYSCHGASMMLIKSQFCTPCSSQDVHSTDEAYGDMFRSLQREAYSMSHLLKADGGHEYLLDLVTMDTFDVRLQNVDVINASRCIFAVS